MQYFRKVNEPLATNMTCGSRYLEDNRDILEGRSVIELGAGPGLVSMVCATLGARTVTATDGFPHIVHCMLFLSE